MLKSYLIVVTVFFCLQAAFIFAQQPGWGWATQTAGNPDYYSYGNNSFAIGTDNQSNLISAGYSASRVFLDDTMLYPTFPNIVFTYLWKQDEFSNTVFIKKYDGIVLSPVSISSDICNNIYLWADISIPTIFEGTLYNSSDGALLIKYDPLGNVIWVRQHHGGQLSVTDNGYCFISGYFTGTKTIGGQTLTSYGGEDMFIAKLDHYGNWHWGKQFGTANGNERCFQVAPLSNGECFIAGKTNGNTNFDGLFMNYGKWFIAKLHQSGVCTWLDTVGQYGTANSVYFGSICSNDPMVVYVYYDYRLSNTLPNGVYLEKFILTDFFNSPETILHIPGSSDVRTRKMVMDSSGNLYLSGYYNEPFTVGSYSYAWESGDFVFKLDGSGNFLWAYDHGHNLQDTYSSNRYYDICVSYQGIVYIALRTNDVMLVQPFFTYPGLGCYALRLSTSGVPEWICSNWVNTIGTEARDIWRTYSADAFVCGNFEGDSFWGNTYLRNRGSSGTDIYVTRFDPANQVLWTACAGGEANQEVSAIYADSDSCSYVTGKFSGNMKFGDNTIQSSGGEDIFVAKLDEQGNWLWAFSAGGPGDDAGLDVVSDSQGNVYACGFFTGKASFGSSVKTSLGITDGFIVKLNRFGTSQKVVALNIVGEDHAKALALDNLNRLWVGSNAVPDSSFVEAQRIVLQRLNSNLDTLDSICSNPGDATSLSGLALDNANNCYLTGTYQSVLTLDNLTLEEQPHPSAFVIKMNDSLAGSWVNHATSEAAIHPNAIIADNNGYSYLTGNLENGGWFGTISVIGCGGKDIFVAKLNNEGVWSWVKNNGSLANDTGNGIALKPGGLCTVVGRVNGRIGLDANWLEPMNEYESFMAELNYGVDISEEPLISPITGLLSAYPNPFKAELKLSFETTEPEEISINIYNLKGQLVRTLQSAQKTAGLHRVIWDGMDIRQNRCAAGVYLLRVQGAKTQITQKVVKLKE